MFKNVVVGISGGVDSAVTALLLKNKGFNVTGIFMKNWDIIDETGICGTEKDYEDAQWVCNKLKIPLIEVNFVKEYWNNVFSCIIEKYQLGYTPNPDVLCNKSIKFDKFVHLARNQFRADAIATGHYAKTSFGPYLECYQPNTFVHLLKARDEDKDQTFFLCQVSQEGLQHCMFPLGNFLKSDVKKIALEAGLDVIVRKKESMGMCFVGKREFKDFISEYIDNKPGNFVDLDTGVIIGEHQGIHYWTVGQRCKIPSKVNAYFVFQKDIISNNILVVQGTNHPALYTDILLTGIPHWFRTEPKEFGDTFGILHCNFRFQHRKPLVPCNVYKTSNQKLIILLSQPLRAITNGQYAVLYQGEECLGSAEVLYCGPSYFSLNQQLSIDNFATNCGNSST